MRPRFRNGVCVSAMVQHPLRDITEHFNTNNSAPGRSRRDSYRTPGRRKTLGGSSQLASRAHSPLFLSGGSRWWPIRSRTGRFGLLPPERPRGRRGRFSESTRFWMRGCRIQRAQETGLGDFPRTSQGVVGMVAPVAIWKRLGSGSLRFMPVTLQVVSPEKVGG